SGPLIAVAELVQTDQSTKDIIPGSNYAQITLVDRNAVAADAQANIWYIVYFSRGGLVTTPFARTYDSASRLLTVQCINQEHAPATQIILAMARGPSLPLPPPFLMTVADIRNFPSPSATIGIPVQ
ncbi:hypothetical protein FRB99_003621, partial [Tulasnella sp. 403]